jgi:amidase
MLAAIAGFDPADPTSSRQSVPDYLAAVQALPAGTRLGVDKTLIEQNADDAMNRACQAALDTFAQAGLSVCDITMPDMKAMATDALQLCVAETALTHRQNYDAHKDQYGPVLTSLIEAGRQVEAEQLLQIQYRRLAFEGEMHALFDEVDLIIQPAFNVAAPTNEDLARQVSDLDARMARLLFTAPIDMSRHPSLTLPGGETEQGAPVAFQLIAPHFAEAPLLAAGHCFQQATGWHKRRPPGL